ncbi:MAG: dimethylsulfonioproprionate lyase family protein [Roseobacter sp.]
MNESVPMQSQRLSSLPDWAYLLREFYDLYRYLPAGGSDRIRSHQRQSREAINRVIKSNAPVVLQERADKPVTAHLRRAIDQGLDDRMKYLLRSVEAVSGLLSWQYGYEKVPRGLATKYAYAEIAGPAGPVQTTEVILGLVLFAPDCTYPAHAHRGITESYVCLSGSVSENHQGVYVPGSMIFNPPEHLHRITVSSRDPALLAYCWLGSKEDLINQKMDFTRSPRSV